MVKLSRTLALSALSTCAASQDASCIATVTRTVTAAGSSCPWAAVDCGACFSLDPQPGPSSASQLPPWPPAAEPPYVPGGSSSHAGDQSPATQSVPHQLTGIVSLPELTVRPPVPTPPADTSLGSDETATVTQLTWSSQRLDAATGSVPGAPCTSPYSCSLRGTAGPETSTSTTTPSGQSTRGTGSVPIPSSGVPSWKYRSYPQTNCSVPVCPTAKPPRYASSSLDAATGESPSAPRTVTKTIRRTLSTGFRSPSASATSAVGDGDVVQITAIVVNHTTTTTTRYSRLPSGSAVAPTGNATSTTAAAGDLTSYSHGHGTGLPGGYELSTRPAASEAWSSSSLVSFSESFDADIGTAPPSFTAVPVRTLVTSRKSSDTFVEGSWPATQTTPAWTRVDETWTEAPPSYTAPASYGSRFRLIRR